MPTIGERLRAARETRGFQLDECHRQTKIHTRILQAMEEDRTSEVLDPAYAKGFLKKYATFLNLDPGPILEEYRNIEEAATAPPESSDGLLDQAAARGARWAVPAVLGAVALVGIGFLLFLARDLYRAVSAPTSTATPPSPRAAQTPPAPKPLVPKSQPIRLGIRAAQDCWMQVKADEKVLFQSILGKGREETWMAQDTIELWVGNAAALTLTLNGRPLEPLGYGVVKGLKVTRYGLQRPKSSRPPE